MAYTLDLIGGRWKPTILWRLLNCGSLRYSKLRKSMPNISERILILQLRELENDGLVSRMIYPEVPPRVEYKLTELGLRLEPVLRLLSDWGMLTALQGIRTYTFESDFDRFDQSVFIEFHFIYAGNPMITIGFS
ncbi:winged helix-turn-helix transcriptional regulator [Pedobacter panaciterrae]